MPPVLEAQEKAGPETENKMDLEGLEQEEGEEKGGTSDPEPSQVDQVVRETCKLLEQLSKDCSPSLASSSALTPTEEMETGGESEEESKMEVAAGPSTTENLPQGGQKVKKTKRRNPGNGEECCLRTE
ncbi:hypothetical protein Y1Q_0018886 [Alligator mississippiensis]|uniref:Uncharacterized protein n=1 Tax=Alligator mississippiensis TaxID=8496 RepID=A0A151M305_ALLMI|nr:hypothetical protein Y1Q_0018886 [Alligator mississippiensis]